MDRYSEQGGAIAQCFEGRDLSSSQLEFGLSRFQEYKISLKHHKMIRLVPYGRISLVYEFANSGVDVVRSSLISAPDSRLISYAGGNLSDNKYWGDISGGFSVKVSSASCLYLGLSHTIGRERLNYGALSAQLNLKF